MIFQDRFAAKCHLAFNPSQFPNLCKVLCCITANPFGRVLQPDYGQVPNKAARPARSSSHRLNTMATERAFEHVEFFAQQV